VGFFCDFVFVKDKEVFDFEIHVIGLNIGDMFGNKVLYFILNFVQTVILFKVFLEDEILLYLLEGYKLNR
jgi:hypothetical protein